MSRALVLDGPVARFAAAAEGAAGEPGRQRGARGFTLLEAVVAMAIFAGAGMALYGLFNVNLLSLGRAQDVTGQIPTVLRAVEYLGTIDPSEQASGQLELDGYDVTWTSRLVAPVRESQTSAGYRGYHELGLYEITFDIAKLDRPVATHTLRAIGQRQVRWPSLQ